MGTKANNNDTPEVKADEVKTDEVNTPEVKADELKADESKADETKTEESKVKEYVALVSFSGQISMSRGTKKKISDKEIVKDLLKAGYIKEVK